MIKKIAKLFAGIASLVAVFALAACGSSEVSTTNATTNSETSATSENQTTEVVTTDDETPVSTTDATEKIYKMYAGTYQKNAGAMGIITGGHIITLYKDGTVNINVGFYASVGETTNVYKGTYTEENGKLTIDYTYVRNEGTDETAAQAVGTITGDSVRMQIFLGASFPDDGTNPDVKGITYYEVEKAIYNRMSKIYIGTYKDDDTTKTYVLSLNKDNSFTVYYNYNDLVGKASGTYSIYETLDLDEVNTITFKYDIVDNNGTIIKTNHEVVSDYSNESVFKFNYLINETENTEAVSVVYTI